MKKSEITRQRFLDAAAKWFRNKGLAFTSLNDLAQVLDVKASSIYYYFDSKDALIEEVLRIGIEVVHREVRSAVDALGPGADHRARIEAAIHAHLKSVLGHDDYTSANIINYSHASEEVRARHLSVRRAYGDYWARLLEGAQGVGEIAAHVDLSLARMFLIGSLNWSVDWYRRRGKSIRQIADECARNLFEGIAPAAATPSRGAGAPRVSRTQGAKAAKTKPKPTKPRPIKVKPAKPRATRKA